MAHDHHRDDGVDSGEDAAWSAVLERVRSILTEVARAGTTLTYAELRERLGVSVPHRGPRDLAALLRAASLAEEAAGRGLVSAVVVGPSGRPGAGWFRLAAEAGRDVGDRERAWRRERARLAGAPPGPAALA
jgi:hypothetical protein